MKKTLLILLVILTLTACVPTPTPTPAPSPSPSPTTAPPPTATPVPTAPVLIGELQTGVPGDNNREFIELYNPTADPLDMAGYRLVYRLASSKEDLPIYAWETTAWLPAHGHLLLVREGQEDAFGVVADGLFTQPLNTNGGGLALRDPDGAIVDCVGWGNAPEIFVEGSPAPVPENGSSIERLPGGAEGNGQDTDDNSADFVLNPAPALQNVGSLPTPAESNRFFITLSAPATVEPGRRFDYRLEVVNHTGGPAQEVQIAFRVPVSLTIIAASDDGLVDGNLVLWTAAEMGADETRALSVTVETPRTYVTLLAQDYAVRAADYPPEPGPAVRTRVTGGILPIAAARSRALMGEIVTVEGVATMYTGGYYAGTNNAKFYLQDESGGIQIQCFDENGAIPTVQIGDRVRVTGEVGAYRNAMQIVHQENPTDIVILGHDEPPAPQEVTVAQAAGDPAVSGRLIAVTGQAIRIEEFTYSYEIDLADDTGHVLLVYVDKLTGMDLDIEKMEVGHRYTIAGISEMYNDTFQLKPRLPADIAEIYPPVLAVTADAPHNVLPGETLAYTFTVFNHTGDDFHNVVLTATLPAGPAALVDIGDSGLLDSGVLRWTLPALPAGQNATFHFTAAATGDAGRISVARYAAWADEWPLHETGLPLLTFIGDSVPIYAIQGPGFTSPYKLDFVDTAGLVTGLFPGLGGFWIQSLTPDDDPATSEGLFVYVGDLDIPPVTVGDVVRVHGRVRERSNQTELHLTARDDITITAPADAADEPLPTPVELHPPTATDAAPSYYEPLEGMLVGVTEPALAVAPTSKYGEYVLVRADTGVERVMHGQETGLFIIVDDGALVRHDDSTTLPYTVRTGDRVGNIVGPLAYTFGHYKIEPLAEPEVLTAPVGPLPQLLPPGPDELSIASFNVENFFDSKDPHKPSDPPKPTRSEYEHKRDQIATAIAALGLPTIIGLQEVENIGVLEDLAAHPLLADYGYQAALIEGPSSRDIDVGFLVRSDRATLEGVGQYQAPEGLFSRPPLMITVTLHTASAGDLTVYAIVNHFISKAGGETLTEPRRVLEAEWNAHLVDEILIRDPQAYVAVLGDLNDYYDSPPLQALTAGDLPGGRLVHTAEMIPPNERYSYIFQGVSQLLDHILVTPALAAHQVRADALHINADYPPPAPDATTPYHCSDHDPVLAVFSW